MSIFSFVSSLFLADRRLPGHEACFEHFGFGLWLALVFVAHFNVADEQPSRFLSHFKARLVYRTERRVHQLAKKPVAKAHDGHIVGDGESFFLYRLHGSHGQHIIIGKDRIRRCAEREQLFSRLLRFLQGAVRALDNQVFFYLQAAVGERVLVAAQTVRADEQVGGRHEVGNAFTALVDQVQHGFFGAHVVVHDHFACVGVGVHSVEKHDGHSFGDNGLDVVIIGCFSGY